MFITTSSTASAIPGGLRISDQTVRNRLSDAGIRTGRPVKAVVLTQRHRQKRLQWAQRHRVWPHHRWGTVWFSDESWFPLQWADGRAMVYRRRNERFAANYIQQVNRFGGGSVRWTATSCTDGTNLVQVKETLTAQRYCDEIFQPHVLPIMQRNSVRFQQDNARPHTARMTTVFFKTHNIAAVLPWPFKSPDFNPTDHLWDELDRRLRQR